MYFLPTRQFAVGLTKAAIERVFFDSSWQVNNNVASLAEAIGENCWTVIYLSDAHGFVEDLLSL